MPPDRYRSRLHPFLDAVPYGFHRNTRPSSNKDATRPFSKALEQRHIHGPHTNTRYTPRSSRAFPNDSRNHSPETPDSPHDAKIQAVLQHSRARRTIANHQSAVRAFRAFCTEFRYVARPASEHTLCAYVAHLASSMAGSSIANALSGVRAWHEAVNAPWNNSSRLQQLIKGATNMAPAHSTRPPRPPVTIQMLELLYNNLDHRDNEDCAVLAAALTAFWAQLRIGEILGTSSSSFNPRELPSRSDLSTAISHEGSRTLKLPRTKTSQIRGELVVITSQAAKVDPIAALSRHFTINRTLPNDTQLFAFTHRASGTTKILTQNAFLARCNTIWHNSGIARTTGHSFRIGGTSALLKAHVAPEVVKTMGRWNSDAFYKYWRDISTIAVQHAELISRRNGDVTDVRLRASPAPPRRSGGPPRHARRA